MTDVVIIQTTFDDESLAKSVSSSLVTEGLVACAQISQPVTSLYSWEGKLESSKEWAVTLKTTRSKVEDIKGFLEEHHNYDVPEMVVIPVIDGLDSYLDWIRN